MTDLFEQRIVNCAYPGRGIIQGLSEDGENVFQVYWIMGRSENSRNRIFVQDDIKLSTQAADPAKCEDPSLVIYEAMLESGKNFLVSNGDQTRTIHTFIEKGEGFIEALNTREREPDAPNYTPRISGLVNLDQESPLFMFSILKANASNPDLSDRNTFQKSSIEQGSGFALTTYQGDGNPLPSYSGEPFPLPLKGSAEEILDTYWEALDVDNKISLAVKSIHLKTKKSSIILKNKYQAV